MKSKVILAWPKSNGHNKYLDILYKNLETNNYEVLSHRDYRFKFLFKKIDFFHFHWIDSFVGFNLIKSTIATLLFVVYIKFLKLKKTKIIWTMHNSNPFTHKNKNPKLEKFLVGFLWKNVDIIIVHSKFQISHIPTKYRKKAIYIPHHNYEPVLKLNKWVNRDYYLFFGSIVKYKDIDDLIKVFNEIKDKKLLILGPSNDVQYVQYLKNLIKNDNIILINKYLDDEELERYVKESKGVILPFKKITNSGSAIYALSCKKKIFMRKNITSEELINEFDLKNVVYTFKALEELEKSLFVDEKTSENDFNLFLKQTNIKLLINKLYFEVFK